MGPNGSGKSTLAQVLAGHPAYEVTGGHRVTYDGEDLLAMDPEERAQKGLFLAFQYPGRDPRASRTRTSCAPRTTSFGRQGASTRWIRWTSSQIVEDRLKLVDMDPAMLNRSVNAGFSGGEKKRNEILQMAVLGPTPRRFSTRPIRGSTSTRCAWSRDGVNSLRRPDNATIVVTHYQRLLNYIVPDYVHVLAGGRIVRSGGKELAVELEARGYDWLTRTRDARERDVGDPDVRRRLRRAHRATLRAEPDVAAADPTRGLRAIPRTRIPDATRRRLALHERRADRRCRVHAAARRRDRPRPAMSG